MPSLLTLLGSLTTIFIVLASPVKSIRTFPVGDSEGWHNPGINHPEYYTEWTSGKKFHAGDILSFEYKNDSVVVVDKWGYYHCDTTKLFSVYNDGNTTIILENPGDMYFISGDPQHCEEGQRLFTKVIPLPPRISSIPRESPAPSPNSGYKANALTMVSLLLAFSIAILALAWVVI